MMIYVKGLSNTVHDLIPVTITQLYSGSVTSPISYVVVPTLPQQGIQRPYSLANHVLAACYYVSSSSDNRVVAVNKRAGQDSGYTVFFQNNVSGSFNLWCIWIRTAELLGMS